MASKKKEEMNEEIKDAATEAPDQNGEDATEKVDTPSKSFLQK